MSGADAYQRLFELSCEQDLDGVLVRTLELLIEVTGAERGFVVTIGDEGRLDVRAARNLDGTLVGEPGMRPSRTVVRDALRSRLPVRVARAQEDDALSERPSVAAASLQSILAVPVLAGARVACVVCVDSKAPAAFDAETERRLEELSAPLQVVLSNATRRAALERQSRTLASRLGEGQGPAIVGESPGLQAALDLVRRAATVDVPVLILGETGTGKELLAREVHRHSARRAGPFVALSCAALPEELLEAELFGHTAGAFTGATEERAGRFAEADGGTLFLDEVGELGPAAQGRFLRVLESGEIQRLGDDRSRRVDVRIVSATHRNLLSSSLGFRGDLFYRLAGVTVALPPLRERGDDVLLLAEVFALEAALEQARPVQGLSPAARERVVGHPWPGNVRELRNAMQRAVLFCRQEWIEPGDLPEEIRSGRPAAGLRVALARAPESWDEVQETKRQAGLEVERAFARQLLAATRGNVAEAARRAGLSRPAFYDLLERAELTAADFRRPAGPS